MENFFIQREGTECSTILSFVPSYSVRTLPPIINRKVGIGAGLMSPTKHALQELRYSYLPLDQLTSVIIVGVVKMKEKLNHSAPRGVISRNGDVSFTSTQEWN